MVVKGCCGVGFVGVELSLRSLRYQRAARNLLASAVSLAYSAYSSSTGAGMAREKRERDGSKDGLPDEKRARPQLAR